MHDTMHRERPQGMMVTSRKAEWVNPKAFRTPRALMALEGLSVEPPRRDRTIYDTFREKAAMEAMIARMRTALEFYASAGDYDKSLDCGSKAREALK